MYHVDTRQAAPAAHRLNGPRGGTTFRRVGCANIGCPRRPLPPLQTEDFKLKTEPIPLLDSATRRLAEAGIESARLEAELLLEHVTGVHRLHRQIYRDRAPTDSEAARFEELVAQRALRIPLQHITGTAHFLDLKLNVTPDVLIPRPETEQLVLAALERLRDIPRPRVADLGTGSGCIALALAKARADLGVDAYDLSPAALAVARTNAERHRLSHQVRFHQGDVFGTEAGAALPGSPAPFDLIATNPPYIPASEVDELSPEVRDHDPRMALDGGPDGLAPYRHLARHALGWLKPGGWLLAEFGDGQGPDLLRLFQPSAPLPETATVPADNGIRVSAWTDICLGKDLSGRDRILIVLRSRGDRPDSPAGP